MHRYKLQILIVINLVFLSPLYALETLSYSGRLVQTNGSPVVGPVTIRAELAYTNALTTVLCTEDIPTVTLTKGVFHVKLNLDCTLSGFTLTQVLSQVPAGESVAIQISDVTDLANPKSYNFQALHAIPFANVASQLVQMGATPGKVLAWDGTKWSPALAGGGGTVTSVSGTLPISVANGTAAPVVSISQANTTTNGYLSNTDWNTFNNKQNALPGGGNNTHYYRGDGSWQTLNTDAVPEGAKLYFENARVLLAPLTGFLPSSSAIVDTDTILQAFNKTQGQINTINSDATHFLIKDSADTLSGNIALTGVITSDPVLGDIVVRGTPMGMTSAVSKSYVDAGDALKVSKSGDTVSGILTLDDDLKIKATGAGTNYVTVRANSGAANYNLILPTSAGSTGQFLQTDGSGILSWVAQSSSATPTGSAGGDLAGTYPNPTVPGLASKISTTLSDGKILIGNGSNVATAQTVSGDATLSNAGVLTLSNTAVTAGTYKSVTVDAKGRITAGTNPTTLAGYGITDTLVTGVSVTAPLTNTGTSNVPLIGMPAATALVDGYLALADFNTFNNKQNAITASSTIGTGSITTNLQGGVVLNPHNTASGNTGELQFKELVANGTNYVALKAPDSITTNTIYTLPSSDGSTGQVLTTNASGVLSWSTVATGSTTLVGDIGGTIGANTIGAGKVTLTHLSATGTKDNSTYLRGDYTFANFMADVRAVTLSGLSTATNAVITTGDTVLSSLGKLQKQITDLAISAVGGDLSGNLPNPTVAKIQGRAVTNTAPLAGQVLKYNTGTPAWEPSYVLVGDLKSSALGNLFPGTGCASNQTLYYSVVGDAFSCVDIGSLDGSKITTGTIAAARLPASATFWDSATGGINYAGGNVGIGTAAPASKLHLTDALPILLTVERNSNQNALIEYKNTLGSMFAGLISGTNNFGIGTTNDLATGSKLVVANSGNVGIGTAAPGTKLHVADSTNGLASFIGSTLSSVLIQTKSNGGADSFGGIDFTNDNYATKPIARIATDSTAGGSKLVFGTSNSYVSGITNQAMTIDYSGNVGIGTTAPSQLFQLTNASAGGGDQTLAQIGFGSGSLFLTHNAPYLSGNLRFDDGSWRFEGNGSGAYIGIGGDILFGNITAGTAGALAAPTQKMVITTAGNVGIGTMAPTATLHLKAGAAAVNKAPLKFTSGVNLTTPEAGAIEYDGTNLYYTDNTNTRKTLGVTGAGITTLGGLSGTSQTFATGTAGTAPAFNSATTTHTLNIPMAATAAVTAGLISKAEYDTFSAKQAAFTTSAGLLGILSDETGSGSAVFSASPTFTGVPLAPTAAVDTNTTQIATTAFVLGQASAVAPLMDGVAAVGTSLRYTRQDHVHPVDTSRAPAAGSTSITTLGTVTTGTWNGTVVDVAHGGTGKATLGLNKLLYGNGTTAVNELALPASLTTTSVLLSTITTGAPAWSTSTAGNVLKGSLTGVAFGPIDATDLPAGTLSGSGTTGYVPYYSAATTLANSPMAVSGSNVGIGTTTPGAKLEVSGNAYVTGQIRTFGNYPCTGYTDCDLVVGDATTNRHDSSISIVSATSAAKLKASGNTLSLVNWTDSDIWTFKTNSGIFTGNVGIGTITPSSVFEVVGANSTADLRLTRSNNVGAASEMGTITFRAPNASGTVLTWAQERVIVENATAGTEKASLAFNTQNSGSLVERMRIDSSGNVGIGTTTPAYKVDVNGQGNFATPIANVLKVTGMGTGYADATNGIATFYSENTAGSGGNVIKVGSAYAPNGLVVKDTGNVGIGTTTPGYLLDVNGTFHVAGVPSCTGCTAFTSVSDRRVKKDIASFDLGLDTVLGINPVTYKYNGLGGTPDDGKEHIGVIAQELAKVAPYMIHKKQVKLHSDDESLTTINEVDASAYVYLIVNAVKALYHKWFDDSIALHREIASVKAEANTKTAKLEEKAKSFEERSKKLEAETKALKKENQLMKAKLEKIEKFLENSNKGIKH